MRQIAIAAAASTRLRQIADWLRGLSLEVPTGGEVGATREVLLVAPTRGAADDVLRILCPVSEGLFGVHRVPLPQLAADLATPELARRGLAPLTGLGAEALAARAISIRTSAGELSYFEPVADTPGFARALAATLRELRAGDIDGGELAASGPSGDDLARLLTTFGDELERWALADDTTLFDLAAREAARGQHPLAGLPLVLLDVSPTVRVQARLIAALAGRAPSVCATLATGDGAGLEALRHLLGCEVRDLDGGAAGNSPNRLERLRQRIFQPRLDGDLECDGPPDSPAEDESVIFLSAPGEGRECVEIARRIRALAQNGMAFDRIAVLLRDPETYLPLMEEALRRASVPANFTRGTTRPHPAGRALLALLACVSEGLSASRFAEYLSLGQVPELDASGGPPEVEVPWVEPEGGQLVFKSLMPAAEVPDVAESATDDDPTGGASDQDPVIAGTLRAPRGWEKLLVDAAVLGGAERWRRRLAGFAAELRLQRDRLGEEEQAARDRVERQLERLGHLRRFALPVVEALAALPTEATWGEWLERLSSLSGRVLRQPELVLSVLAELRPMEQVGPVSLDEVRRTLEDRLVFLRAEPPERRYGRVFVASIPEARGRSFDAVFVPGLAEGIFPRRANEDPLLLDDQRRALREGEARPEELPAADPSGLLAASRLPTQAERIEDERLLLRIAAGAADRQLVASYPNLDALHGRTRVPSFYALDLLRAAEGRLPDLGQLEGRAAASSQALLGWPAPRSPEAAIDEAEFDLSLLEHLLRAPVSEVASRGRYLLASNSYLEVALRTRWRRWRPAFSAADGLVDPDAATLEVLAPHRLDRRSFSATALQGFAICPYRFYLASIARLRPREKASPLEQLDPLTRGSLFHEVQFELFRELEERELLPMREDDLAALLELSDRVLDRVAARYADELAPAIPRVWANEVESLRTDLRGWIDASARAESPWRPIHFELSFGGEPLPVEEGGEDPAAREPVQTSLFGPSVPVPEPAVPRPLPGMPEPVEGARPGTGPWTGDRPDAEILEGALLRGAIDLVELDEERRVLRVTDHKTGKPPKKRQLMVAGGETLQPVLYALAAEKILGLPADAGRLFFCTRRGGFESREVPLDDQSRETASLVLRVIDRAIRDGFLPAAPRGGACERCDYHAVCGPFEELRLRRKHPQRLTLLKQLRSLP